VGRIFGQNGSGGSTNNGQNSCSQNQQQQPQQSQKPQPQPPQPSWLVSHPCLIANTFAFGLGVADFFFVEGAVTPWVISYGGQALACDFIMQ